MYWLSDEDRPAYMQSDDQSLSALAKASGEHPAETRIRYQLDSDGRGVFHVRFFNLDLEALPGFLKADWMLPGIGDAGAHVSFIMDAGWPTFVLSYWHRDRAVFTLEESIRMMTSGPMRVIGFTARGSLEVGKLSYPRADAGIAPTAYLLERRRWYCWWPAKRAGAAFWASTLGNVVGRAADGAAGTSRRMPGCAW